MLLRIKNIIDAEVEVMRVRGLEVPVNRCAATPGRCRKLICMFMATLHRHILNAYFGNTGQPRMLADEKAFGWEDYVNVFTTASHAASFLYRLNNARLFQRRAHPH